MNSFGGSWDDKKCFNKELEWNIHLDDMGYVNLFKSTAEYIIPMCHPKEFVDLGGGMGGYSLAMRDKGVSVRYYDQNKFHYEYYVDRVLNTIAYNCDFTEEKIQGDLVASIEVFEHIPDSKLIPFLMDLQCNYFHFSSTPNTSELDKEWGHINIKNRHQWIDLFQLCGFRFERDLMMPTPWAMLFSK